MNKLKIAIPTEDKSGLKSKVSLHFGPSETFTIINENGDFFEVINNKSVHKGGEKLPPEFLSEKGISTILCRDMGPRAIDLCNKNNIDVYIIDADTVQSIFDIWKEKKPKKADKDDCCDDHKL